jgi:hypothetical protein
VTQLQQFLGMLQSGQEMSLETQWGVTLIFEDQGNPGGYSASTGAVDKEMFLESAGVMIEARRKAFRIRRELLTADGIEIVAKKTIVKADGVRYLVDDISDHPSDTCVHLNCKEP